MTPQISGWLLFPSLIHEVLYDKTNLETWEYKWLIKFISQKIHPTFISDAIPYKVTAFTSCGKFTFVLPALLPHYQETLRNINQQCSRVTNYLHLKQQENTVLGDGNDLDTSEGSLTLKYNDKGLNVNSIHCITIILCKRNLLVYPQLLLMMVRGFRQVNWGFVPGMLEQEKQVVIPTFLQIRDKHGGYPPFLWA